MPSLLSVAVQACASGGAEGPWGRSRKANTTPGHRLKQLRGIATRFDKRAANHHAAVYRGAAVVVTDERIG
jgi:transposase